MRTLPIEGARVESVGAGDRLEAIGEMSCLASALTTGGKARAPTVGVGVGVGWRGVFGEAAEADANFRLDALYSQLRLFSRHRLHFGKSPEHLVL